MQSSEVKKVGSILNSKKGWFAQAIIGIVVIFVLILIYSLTFIAQSTINDELQTDKTLSNQSKGVMQDQTDSYPLVFDSASAFVAVFIWIFVMALAYKGASNPLFVVVAFVVIAALAFVGALLSNVWHEVDSDAGINSFTSEFPFGGFLLDHYLVFVLVLLFSGVIVYMVANGGL